MDSQGRWKAKGMPQVPQPVLGHSKEGERMSEERYVTMGELKITVGIIFFFIILCFVIHIFFFPGHIQL